ncbi:MAG: hypothetical protein ACLTTH_07820 [Holdemanella porci]
MMIATCIFGLTYGFVAYYEQLRGTENLTIIDQTVFKHMDSSLAIVLAVLITIIYLTFVYKRNKKVSLNYYKIILILQQVRM